MGSDTSTGYRVGASLGDCSSQAGKRTCGRSFPICRALKSLHSPSCWRSSHPDDRRKAVHKRLPIIAGLISLLGSPATLWTQEGPATQYRQGLWIGAGIGPSHAQMDCSLCGSLSANDAWKGGTGYGGFFAIGGTPRSNLLLGGELNVYFRSSSTQEWDELFGREYTLERETLLGTAAFVVQFYPLSAAPAFLKGGVGLGHYALLTRSQVMGGMLEFSHDSNGWALQAGAGYDLLLNRRLALVPFASVVQLFTESAQWEGGSGPSNPRYVQFGVGLHRY